MATRVDDAYRIIKFKHTINDFCFLPNATSVLFASDIDGTLHRRDIGTVDTEEDSETQCAKIHDTSIRSLVVLGDDGNRIATGSSDCSIQCFDTVKFASLWRTKDAHRSPVNCVYFRDCGSGNAGDNFRTCMTTGDDEGFVGIWDIRTGKSTFDEPLSVCKDYVSDIIVNGDKAHELLVASGDGTLSLIDCRKNKVREQSDDQEEELLSLTMLKGGQKVAVGTQEGNVLIFSTGKWRDQSDRFPGHPDAVNVIRKVDSDTVLSGCGDGIIRLVNLQPNKLLGVIGDHGDLPIERLSLNADSSFLGSVSHDNCVKLWDIRYFWQDDEDDDVEKDSDSSSPPESEATASSSTTKHGKTKKRTEASSSDRSPSSGRERKKRKSAVKTSSFAASDETRRNKDRLGSKGDATRARMKEFFSDL